MAGYDGLYYQVPSIGFVDIKPIACAPEDASAASRMTSFTDSGLRCTALSGTKHHPFDFRMRPIAKYLSDL